MWPSRMIASNALPQRIITITRSREYTAELVRFHCAARAMGKPTAWLLSCQSWLGKEYVKRVLEELTGESADEENISTTSGDSTMLESTPA